MLDIVVGIVIVLFVLLGLREGLVKAILSVVAVLASLFLASWFIDFLSQGTARFSEPGNLSAIIAFLLAFAIIYILLDVALLILFTKIIYIRILGPVDKICGILVGGFKGILICGIVLQLMLFMPISKGLKQDIVTSYISSFSISVYEWAYPYAKQIMPKVNIFMKDNILEKIREQSSTKTVDPEPEKTNPEKIEFDVFLENIKKPNEMTKNQQEKIIELLKERKLLPNVPQGKPGS
ncbi:MAG: CvpA family protein [Candidatus Saganbacteria bacterium]|nr:CvpA family protein [Candidatus Saganbacteria bacterium]